MVKFVWISLCFVITFWISDMSWAESLPEETPLRADECANSVFRESCPSDEVIAVKDIQYGTKLKTTCSHLNNSSGCCEYDANDCFLADSSSTTKESCSGRELCKDVTVSTVPSGCNQSYTSLNHYLTMEYYCISDSRISKMCISNSKQDTNLLQYLMNQDYPTAVRNKSTSCSCSIETYSCSSQIKVYFVHFQLGDGGGSCSGTQRIEIEDNGSITTFTCNDKNDYEITLKMTSSSNYIKVSLYNLAAVNDGYFWIGFQGTDSSIPLNVSCPAAARTMCMDCSIITVSDATVSTTDVSQGTVVNIYCNEGYTLEGAAYLTCESGGNWDNNFPVCKKDCTNVTVSDATVSTTNVSQGTVVNINCNTGYTLEGFTNLTCQSGGTWDNNFPVCKKGSIAGRGYFRSAGKTLSESFKSIMFEVGLQKLKKIEESFWENGCIQ